MTNDKITESLEELIETKNKINNDQVEKINKNGKKIIDKNIIDTGMTNGNMINENITLELNDLHFVYSNRPDQPVLKSINLVIAPRMLTAICGRYNNS